MHGGEVDEAETPRDRVAGRGPPLRIEAVPLVEGDDEGPARVEQVAEEPRVLLGDPLSRVEHQDRDVRRLDGLERLDGAQLLDHVGDARAAPEPRRVDEHEPPPAPLEGNEHAVARRPRGIVGDDPVLAEETVDEGGLAGVGPADDRDPHRPPPPVRLRLRVVGRVGSLFPRGHEGPHQGGDPAPVGGRDRDRGVEPEGVELAEGGPLVQPVGLVDGEDDRLAEPANSVRDRVVGRGPSRPRVGEEHDPVRFVERAPDLVTDAGGEVFGIAGESAGVHDDEPGAVMPGGPVAAVPGEARVVGDEGVAGAGEPVEQGRLPDVGPSCDGDYGKHGRSLAGPGPGPAPGPVRVSGP